MNIANDCVVDLSSWKMKQFRAFQRVATAGDLDGMISMIEDVTTFPDGISGVDDLEIEQWSELIEVVSDKLTAKFQSNRKNS